MSESRLDRTARRDAAAAPSEPDGDDAACRTTLVSEQVQRLAVCRRGRRRAVDLRAGDGHGRSGRSTVGAAHARTRASSSRFVAIAVSAADVRLRAVRAASRRQRRRDAGLVYHRAQRRGGRAAQHLGRRPLDRPSTARAVVEHRRHSRRRDDPAGDAAQDAGALAGRGVDGPAGGLDRRTCAARRCLRRSQHARAVPAELRVRGRRGAAVARAAAPRAAACGRRRSWAAITSSSCSGAAAWAKCGGRSTGCWRAARRSSWFGPSCSARAADAETLRHAAAVRARGAGDGRAELAAHDPRLRLRRDRRSARSTT